MRRPPADSAVLIEAIFETPLGRPIEPVVQVAALDDGAAVAAELDAAVITPLLEQHLLRFAAAFATTTPDTSAGTGIWIDGVYGAGKSHLAKLLALFASNRTIDGGVAGLRIAARLPPTSNARRTLELALARTAGVDTHILPLSLASLAGSSHSSLAAELLGRHYRAIGYCGNLLYARVIEAQLDRLGRFDALRAEAKRRSGIGWSELAANPTFHANLLAECAVLVAPEQFGTVREVERALDHAARGMVVDLGLALDELHDWLARREEHLGRPQRMLCILDEAGAWIGRDASRLAELGHLLELAQRRPSRPLWVVVVTHADLAAVSARSGAPQADRRTIESRFAMQLSLDDENLARVLEQRVLAKTAAGRDQLVRLYAKRGGAIRDLCELGGCSRTLAACDEQGFVANYPFAPYWSELVPELVRALRERGGHDPELSGSTRTLLALAQDVLCTGRGASPVGPAEDADTEDPEPLARLAPLAHRPVGALAPFDALYRAFVASADVPSDLAREVSHSIGRIRRHAFEVGPGEPSARTPLPSGLAGLALRLPALLALLDALPSVPRTLPNLARLLLCDVREDLLATTDALRVVVHRLEELGVVSCLDGQVDLLVGPRRLFEQQVNEVAASLDHAAVVAGFSELFVRSNAPVRWEKWLGLRAVRIGGASFDLRLWVDGKLASRRGELALHVATPLATCATAGDGSFTLEAIEQQSVRAEEQATVFVWCAPSPALEQDLRGLLARREVLGRAGTGTRAEQTAMAERERSGRARTIERLRRTLEASLLAGWVVFRGSRWSLAASGSASGPALTSIFAELGAAIYPKLRQVPQRIAEPAEPIRALFEGRPMSVDALGGLALLGPEGAVVASHPLFDAVRIALAVAASSPGEPAPRRAVGRPRRGRLRSGAEGSGEPGNGVGVPGADLLGRLRAPPYGWDPSVVQLGVAAMVRTGALEVVDAPRAPKGTGDRELGAQLAERAAFARLRFRAPDAEAGRVDLGEVRELVVELLGTRQLAETQEAIDAAVTRLAEQTLQRIAVAQSWYAGAGIVAPTELEAAASGWRSMRDAADPVARLASFVRRRDFLLDGFRLAERTHRWLGRWGSAVGGLRRLVHALEAYSDELPESGAARALTRVVSGWERDCSAMLKESFPPLLELERAAEGELEPLVKARRARALARIDEEVARLAAGSGSEPSVDLLLRGLREAVAAESDPCAVAAASGRLDALVQRYETASGARAREPSPRAKSGGPDER